MKINNYDLYRQITELIILNYAMNENFNKLTLSLKFPKYIPKEICQNSKNLSAYLLNIRDFLFSKDLEDIFICDWAKYEEDFDEKYEKLIESKLYSKMYDKKFDPIYGAYLMCRIDKLFLRNLAWKIHKMEVDIRLENFKKGIIFDPEKEYPYQVKSSVYTRSYPFRN